VVVLPVTADTKATTPVFEIAGGCGST